MRNILALVGAAVVGFLAVGWYLGWYQVTSRPTAQGQQSLNVNINAAKITEDVKKGVAKGEEIVDSLRDRPAVDAKAPVAGPATSFFTPTTRAAENGSDAPSGWRPIQENGPDSNARGPRN